MGKWVKYECHNCGWNGTHTPKNKAGHRLCPACRQPLRKKGRKRMPLNITHIRLWRFARLYIAAGSALWLTGAAAGYCGLRYDRLDFCEIAVVALGLSVITLITARSRARQEKANRIESYLGMAKYFLKLRNYREDFAKRRTVKQARRQAKRARKSRGLRDGKRKNRI